MMKSAANLMLVALVTCPCLDKLWLWANSYFHHYLWGG
jgi:hypothetical protein